MSRRRILDHPQFDGSPSWELQPVLFIASHGTSARSSARRRRSSSRIFGRDICRGDQAASRAKFIQHKTQRPAQFEITPATRDAVQTWFKRAGLKADDFARSRNWDWTRHLKGHAHPPHRQRAGADAASAAEIPDLTDYAVLLTPSRRRPRQTARSPMTDASEAA